MEAKKIINFLSDSSTEESKFATKNDMLQAVQQKKVNTMKTTLSYLKQKALNQVFVIILMLLFQLQEI